MIRLFVEVCGRRNSKVDVNKSKVRVLGGEEELECEIQVVGAQLEQVSEFNDLGCVLDESGTYIAKYDRKVASGRKVQVLSGPWLMLGVSSLSMQGVT